MQVQVFGDGVDLTPVEPHLRHVPSQARSRERLTRVLQAADRILAEEGADALISSRVAEVAGVPVGSIYHLFGDKEAIVDALAMGYWAAFAEAVDRVADRDEESPLAEPIVAIFDALAESFRAEPGFLALWFSPLRTQRVRDTTRVTRAVILGSVQRILAVHWPAASGAEQEAAARMVVLTGDGLLREAFRIAPEGDASILAECCLMLDAYLAARLGDPT